MGHPTSRPQILQPADEYHPLLDADHGYLIFAKERLDAYVKNSIARWVVRKLFDWCGVAGETRRHDLGIMLYEDVAVQIVTQKNIEAKSLKPGDKWYGFVWQWKQSPVNSLLGAESVHYGNSEYSGTDIDGLHRARNPTLLVPLESVDSYQCSNLDETFRRLEAKVREVKVILNSTPVA